MYFTQDDIRRIERGLQERTIKDSQLPEAEPLFGSEEVAIIQNGVNRRVNLNKVVEKSSEHYLDFYNVSDRNCVSKLTLVEAISYVPISMRKPGLVITYIDENCVWRIMQYRGLCPEHYNYTSHWHEPGVTPVDDEDLTFINNDAVSVIRFKDRESDSDDNTGLSGKGRKILRQRRTYNPDPEGTEDILENTLDETDFDLPNTVYVIRYNFRIRGRISLPVNCELHFEGGKLIFGNNQLILNQAKITGIMGSLNDYIVSQTVEDGVMTEHAASIIGFAKGQILFNEDHLEYYDGNSWKEIASQDKKQDNTEE